MADHITEDEAEALFSNPLFQKILSAAKQDALDNLAVVAPEDTNGIIRLQEKVDLINKLHWLVEMHLPVEDEAEDP